MSSERELRRNDENIRSQPAKNKKGRHAPLLSYSNLYVFFHIFIL